MMLSRPAKLEKTSCAELGNPPCAENSIEVSTNMVGQRGAAGGQCNEDGRS